MMPRFSYFSMALNNKKTNANDCCLAPGMALNNKKLLVMIVVWPEN
jgi:hypothetical protein